MTILTVTKARAQLYKLLERAALSHDPIQINWKKGNAVLVSEEDWRAIMETLHLVSIPEMRDSIRKGLKTPLRRTAKKLTW
jgi:antitoxin YefM